MEKPVKFKSVMKGNEIETSGFSDKDELDNFKKLLHEAKERLDNQ
jgi:dsDNA-binding SOS-regulon protein